MRFPAEKWKTRASRGAGVGWDSLRSARVWGGGRGSVRRGGENPQKAAEFLPRAGPGGVTCSPSRCFPRDPSRGEARAPERREEEGWASGELVADAGFPAAGFCLIPSCRQQLPGFLPRFPCPVAAPHTRVSSLRFFWAAEGSGCVSSFPLLPRWDTSLCEESLRSKSHDWRLGGAECWHFSPLSYRGSCPGLSPGRAWLKPPRQG